MANQFTKYTGTVTGVVGSLITALDAALVTGQSWTTPFTGTNKKAYRAPSGNRLYLRVQDDAAVTAKEARITGYEVMTDVDTGTNPFPTAAQGVGAVAMRPVRKSFSADATTRSYQIFCDARTAYIFINAADASGTIGTWQSFMFGEFYSLVPSDLWNTMLVGRSTENSATTTNDELDKLQATNPATTTAGHFVARAYNSLPSTNGSLLVGVHGDVAKGVTTFLAGSITHPNPCDGGLYVSPVWINETTATIRGRMRGFWQLCNSATGVTDGEVFAGVGDLSGKTFQIIRNTGNSGIYCIETSATLETN